MIAVEKIAFAGRVAGGWLEAARLMVDVPEPWTKVAVTWADGYTFRLDACTGDAVTTVGLSKQILGKMLHRGRLAYHNGNDPFLWFGRAAVHDLHYPRGFGVVSEGRRSGKLYYYTGAVEGVRWSSDSRNRTTLPLMLAEHVERYAKMERRIAQALPL